MLRTTRFLITGMLAVLPAATSGCILAAAGAGAGGAIYVTDRGAEGQVAAPQPVQSTPLPLENTTPPAKTPPPPNR